MCPSFRIAIVILVAFLPADLSAHVPHDVITAMAVPPDMDPDARWWLLAEHYEVNDLYSSDDGGITWQPSTGACLADFLSDAATRDDGAVVLLGEGRTWWWSEADEAWNPVTNPIEPDTMAGGDQIFLGNHEGVWALDDDGTATQLWSGAAVLRLDEGAGGVVALLEGDALLFYRGEGWQRIETPRGIISATLDEQYVYVGRDDGSVWRRSDGQWEECGISPFVDWNPDHTQIVRLASDGDVLALAHADIGPAISTDHCVTWEGQAAPMEIAWIDEIGPDDYYCWTDLDGAFTALTVGFGGVVVAGYDGAAARWGGTWYHQPLKGGDYPRGVSFSRSFDDDGEAIIAAYGCGIAVTRDWGASWECPGVGLTMPAAQDVEVPVFADGSVPSYGLSDRTPAVSFDDGMSWSVLDGPWERSVHWLDIGPGNRLWAMGTETDNDIYPGDLMVTLDDGITWNAVEGLAVAGDGQVVGVFDYGDLVIAWTGRRAGADVDNSVYLSTDGAATFTRLHEFDGDISDATPWPIDDPERVVTVGREGIAFGWDGDWTWAQLPEDAAITRFIVAADDGTLVASTRTERLLRSHDGGETWEDMGVQLYGQVEALDVRPDFAIHPQVLASTPSGLFAVDEDGTYLRWFGLQQVDDNTDFVFCTADCTVEDRADAALGTVTLVPPGNGIAAWLRGSTVRVIGQSDTEARVELLVDETSFGSWTVEPGELGQVLAEVNDLQVTMHLVELDVIEGDAVHIDAFAGLETTFSMEASTDSGPDDTGLHDVTDGSCGGCNSGATGMSHFLLMFAPLLVRRKRRGPGISRLFRSPPDTLPFSLPSPKRPGEPWRVRRRGGSRRSAQLLPLLFLLSCSGTHLLWVDAQESPSLASSSEATEPTALWLNEVMTDNDSTVMDERLEFPDWLEIYNGGDSSVELGRISLEDSSGTSWSGGNGSLQPGELLLLWADGSVDGAHGLPFRLSSDGERLTLLLDGEPVDRLATGYMQGDTSWARFPDGGSWAITAAPTPGWSNGWQPGASADPTDTLFQAERVGDLDLVLSESSLSSLDQDPYTEVPGSMGYEAAWFSQVGVRLKGQAGSFRTMDGKAAFKVDTNEYEDHWLRGEKLLTLNNMVQDPTCTHEYLAYTLFRALGIPAPRVGWVRLTVNGVAWGLYLLVESVDDVFLERWYVDPTGALYEGAYGVDFYVGSEFDFEYDEGPDPDDRSDLTAVAEILELEATDQNIVLLEELVDLDEFLVNMAVEALILHWDGYSTANNYRLYHDPLTDRFQILPWGTDQTFVDYWLGPWDGYGRVFTFCLENDSCAGRYDETLLQVADVMDSLDLAGELDHLEALLLEDIELDERREQSMDTVYAYLETTRETIESWPDQVREMLE